MTRRIFYVIDSFKVGGAQHQLLELVRHLDKTQYQVAICPIWDIPDLEPFFLETGVEIVHIHKRFSYDFTIAIRLAQKMRQFRPHVVHTWLFTGSLWGRVAAILAFCPRIIASERSVRPDGHDPLGMRLVYKCLAHWTDIITANSKIGLAKLQGQGFDPSRLRAIINGVDLQRFSPKTKSEQLLQRQLLGIPANTTLIGMVARLSYPKDQAALLRALHWLICQELDVHGIIVGAGSLLSSLETLAGELNIKGRVHFLGAREDIPTCLCVMDIFAFSSLWEGMPNAVLEAMAMGLPVVATAVAGTTEVVVEGETGFLVPPSDSDKLAERLLCLIRDPGLRVRMGAAGRQRAVSVFSLEQMVAQTTGLYEETIERK